MISQPHDVILKLLLTSFIMEIFAFQGIVEDDLALICYAKVVKTRHKSRRNDWLLMTAWWWNPCLRGLGFPLSNTMSALSELSLRSLGHLPQVALT